MTWAKAVTAAARLSLLGAAAVLLASCAEGTETLRLAHTQSAEHPVHVSMLYMADRLEKISGGEMTMEVYPSGQLGTERELIELLQIGSIAMTKVSSLSIEGFVPEMRVFSVPYLFTDNDHFWDVLNSEVGDELLASLEPVLLKGLGYYDSGSRSFYTKDAPILTPGDLAGKNIRVLSSRASIEMVDVMGGSATPIAFGELYTAIQQGVVDGAENNPPSYYLSRHYEAAPFYSLDEHTTVPDLVVVSLAVWDRLSPQEQAWLKEAMDDSVTFQRRAWAEASEEAMAAIVAGGATVTRPDKAPFRAAVASIKESHDGTPIGDMIARIDAMAPAASAPAEGDAP